MMSSKDIERLWQLYQQANQSWISAWQELDMTVMDINKQKKIQCLIDFQYSLGQYLMVYRREQQERIAFDQITPMPDFQRRCEFSKQVGKIAQRYFSTPCLVLLGELVERLFVLEQEHLVMSFTEEELAWLRQIKTQVNGLLEACIPGAVPVLTEALKVLKTSEQQKTEGGAPVLPLSLALKRLSIQPIYCVENQVSNELMSLADQTLRCAMQVFERARVKLDILPAITWSIPKRLKDVIVMDQTQKMWIEERSVWTVDNHWSDRDMAQDHEPESLSNMLRNKRPRYLDDGVIEVVFLDDNIYTEFERDDFLASFSDVSGVDQVLAQYQQRNVGREIVVAQNLVGLTPYYGEVVAVSAPFYNNKHIQSHVVVAHELMHRLGALGHTNECDNLLYYAPDTAVPLEKIHLSLVQLAAIYCVLE